MQKHIWYLLLRTLSQSGKSWTVTGFYPTFVHLLPHLVGKKSDIVFLYFLTKKLTNRGFFCTEKTWEILEFSQKLKFCSNLQNGVRSLKVCINYLLFTPLDYYKFYQVQRKWMTASCTKFTAKLGLAFVLTQENTSP